MGLCVESSQSHTYGLWEVTEEGVLEESLSPMVMRVGLYLYQKRTCSKCGFIETDIQVHKPAGTGFRLEPFKQ